MQTFQLEVNDNISDKILWLLNSFKNDIKIKKIKNNILDETEYLNSSKQNKFYLDQAISEVTQHQFINKSIGELNL